MKHPNLSPEQFKALAAEVIDALRDYSKDIVKSELGNIQYRIRTEVHRLAEDVLDRIVREQIEARAEITVTIRQPAEAAVERPEKVLPSLEAYPEPAYDSGGIPLGSDWIPAHGGGVMFDPDQEKE